ATSEKAVLCIVNTRDPRYRGHYLILFLPRIHPIVGPKYITADNFEVLAKLILEFSLPLEREVCRRDDENSFDEATNLQLFNEEPGHDRLSRARIVRKQKANARQFEEIVINRL